MKNVNLRSSNTVDWVQDATNNNASVNIPKFLVPISSWLVFSIVGIFIGLISGLISITTVWLANIKIGKCTYDLLKFQKVCQDWSEWTKFEFVNYLFYVFLSISFAFISAFIVKKLNRKAAGSGISEIKCIIAGFEDRYYLKWPVLLVKTFTLPFAIASGLSIGKEGPSVHVSCCIGELVASLFPYFHKSKMKMREIFVAASAAGVACAFGSPIGGVIFSIEEMCHTYNTKTLLRSFFCALAATVTLSALNPFQTGKLVLFQVSYDKNWHFFEIFYFVLIGVFGGLYGALVIKYNIKYVQFRKKYLSENGISEAVILTLITAIICYPNPFLRMDMTESMSILFGECDQLNEDFGICQDGHKWKTIYILLLATITRICLLIVSYGCQVPAGIFVPSLAIGATFGRMIGTISQLIQQHFSNSPLFTECQLNDGGTCITPGTYALLGAAAALSGVMRIWVTVVIVIFELTGALTYILPTMIVLLATKSVSDFLSGGEGGIADQMIKVNKMPVLKRDDENYFNVKISQIMKKDLSFMNEIMTVKDILIKLEAGFSGYPLVKSEEDRTLIGYVEAYDLQMKLMDIDNDELVCKFKKSHTIFDAENQQEHDTTEIDLSDIVNQIPISVSPTMTVDLVMKMFKKIGPRVILIVNQGYVEGLITVKDIIEESEIIESGKIRARNASKASSADDLIDIVNKFKTIMNKIIRK